MNYLPVIQFDFTFERSAPERDAPSRSDDRRIKDQFSGVFCSNLECVEVSRILINLFINNFIRGDNCRKGSYELSGCFGLNGLKQSAPPNASYLQGEFIDEGEIRGPLSWRENARHTGMGV